MCRAGSPSTRRWCNTVERAWRRMARTSRARTASPATFFKAAVRVPVAASDAPLMRSTARSRAATTPACIAGTPLHATAGQLAELDATRAGKRSAATVFSRKGNSSWHMACNRTPSAARHQPPHARQPHDSPQHSSMYLLKAGLLSSGGAPRAPTAVLPMS
jgi:hypothetical protein